MRDISIKDLINPSERAELFESVAQDLKWLLKAVIAFIFTFLVGNVVLEAIGTSERQSPTFRTKTRELILEGNKPTVLFIGSSHIYTGVHTASFAFPVANLADSAYDYRSCLRLYQHFAPQLSDVQIAVVELDSVLFFTDTMQRRLGDYSDFYQWGLQPAELDLTCLERIKEGCQLSIPAFGQNRFTPADMLMAEAKPVFRDILPGFEQRDEIAQLNAGAERATHHASISISSPEANLRALMLLLSDLERQGTRVALLVMPHENTYWDTQDAFQANFIDETRSKLEMNPNVIAILDHGREKGLTLEDFADGDHLNLRGALAVSQSLAGELQDLLEDE